MSGGYAFIWDVNDTFEKNFNPELSEIEALSAEDTAELKALIQEHSDETNSKVAKYILDNWTSQLSNFKKVMPTDYKRVLLERAQKVQEAVA
jgi:glutamate synthase domain-containing protein 3